MLGCRVREVYPAVPLADRHAVSIGFTTIAGRACFGVYADREALPDADLIARDIGDELDQLLDRAVSGQGSDGRPSPRSEAGTRSG